MPDLAKREGAFHFFFRDSEGPDKPAGYTVSKKPTLPQGEFGITEFTWRTSGVVTLWFIDDDKFTRTERQAAYHEFTGRMGFKHGG